MLTTVCILVVQLGLWLDLVSGYLVVMHPYLYYFPLPLSQKKKDDDVVAVTWHDLVTIWVRHAPIFATQIEVLF